ncbi:MAG: HD domain-containing protein [Sedimentibacter sp.]|uniref:HD domain-containing protein n=1 Tax=Sedimentibacter sp. TaxID=1960295 RepID=UPI003158B7FA
MIEYFGTDVRRINHALKVYGYAKSMGELEKLPREEQEILEISAILHDIGIKEAERKYSSAAGMYQEIEGPPVAREILSKYTISDESKDRVCHLIGNHHSYSKIDGADFQILVEADFLVNIFEDDIQREQVEIIEQKYFKTKSGRKFIESMYMNAE